MLRSRRGEAALGAVGIAAATCAVIATAVAVTVVRGASTEASPERNCPEKLKADETKVRTSQWEPADDLPELAQYPEIHWQAHAPSGACSREFGPTEWEYEGVVRLRPEDARSLAAGYEWQPVADDASPDPYAIEVWPALAPYIPAGVHWLRSDTYDKLPPQQRWRYVYFDPDRSLVLFKLHDH